MNNFKLVVIGGNRYMEKGPFINFIDLSLKKNIETIVYTDNFHWSMPTSNKSYFSEDILKRNVKVFIEDRLHDKILIELDDKNMMIVCINCHWIIPESIIKRFKGRIFNYHNAKLPKQRGAACHSWRIMQGDRHSCLSIHEISKEIDEGKILMEEKISFPSEINTLADTYAYISNKELKFFQKFFRLNNFKTQFQTNEPSFYWPKLNTDKHGFIDWSWTAIQIMRFCNAFDDPFKGASTFFLGNHVRLMMTSVDDLKTIFHPYQSGIIYRKLSGSIWIATCRGGLKVDKVTGVEYNKLKLGKRFQTPFDVLEQAKTE